MTAKAFYQQALDELNTGNFDQALWALVWTKADGNDAKARASYVKRRAAEAYSAEQWRSVRTPLTWWAVGLWVAANALYLSWCFHFPPGTGFVALIGAFVGFNLLPGLACLFLLWLGRRKLLAIWGTTLVVSLTLTALLLLLTGIDTQKRWHHVSAYSYAVTFADGRRGALDSDVPATAEEIQKAMDEINRMDAQAAVAATHDKQMHETSKGMYWSQQFLKGLEAPYQSVTHLL